MLRLTSVIALCILISDGHKLGVRVNREQWEEFEEFLEWKEARRSSEYGASEFVIPAIDDDRNSVDSTTTVAPPPPINQTALMARYVVNQADWTSVATISTRKDIQTFPTANVISMSDGPLGNGSGIPYMYLTPLDFTAQDLAKDHRASLMMTLAQGTYCKNKKWDSMDPRCARIILSGKIKSLKKTEKEHEVAKQAVFGRHPHLKNMPADHRFFFAKLKIATIALLDNFGGPKFISVRDYLHPPVDDIMVVLQ